MLLTKIKNRLYRFKIGLTQLYLRNCQTAGHTEYTKFIILTRSRSGSNFLVSLLNSHRNVRCYSELFRRGEKIGWGIRGYSGKKYNLKSTIDNKLDDPVKFLHDYIFIKATKRVLATGFKLLYYQAHKGNEKNLWPYLKNLDGLKVIHLKRKNLLKVVVSKKIAESSNKWIKKVGAKDNDSVQNSVELTHEECLSQFTKTKEWQATYEDYFEFKDKMVVIYEELASNTDRVMDEVQDFLNIPRLHLHAGTKKQSFLPVSDLIVNYEELERSFSGTEWESMFVRK